MVVSQVWPSAHAAQAAPPVPHWSSISLAYGTHASPLQQPLHVVALHVDVLDPELDALLDPASSAELDALLDPASNPELDALLDPASNPELDVLLDPASDSELDALLDPAVDPELEAMLHPVVDPELDSALHPVVDLECELDRVLLLALDTLLHPDSLPVSMLVLALESFAVFGRASLRVAASGAAPSTVASAKVTPLTPTRASQPHARRGRAISATAPSLATGTA